MARAPTVHFPLELLERFARCKPPPFQRRSVLYQFQLGLHNLSQGVELAHEDLLLLESVSSLERAAIPKVALASQRHLLGTLGIEAAAALLTHCSGILSMKAGTNSLEFSRRLKAFKALASLVVLATRVRSIGRTSRAPLPPGRPGPPTKRESCG